MDLQVEELRGDVRDAWCEAADALTSRGASVRAVSLPSVRGALAAYYVIAPAEAASNLSRYDGVRYGHRAQERAGDDFHSLTARSRAEGFGAEVQRRILVGTFVLSAAAHAAYYRRAVAVRRAVARELGAAFESVDVLLTPTTPSPAYPIDAMPSPAEVILNDVMTVPVNLAGLPAVSVPTHRLGAQRLPLGMQVVGGPRDEWTALRVAQALEAAFPEGAFQLGEGGE